MLKYRKAVGDAQALPVLEGYAIDRLRASALRDDGTIDPSRAATFLRSHQSALSAFPELAQRIRGAIDASKAVKTAAQQRTTRLAEAKAGKIGDLLGVSDPQDVTRTIGTIFQRQDAVQQFGRLRAAIGKDKEALEGLRRGVVDYVGNRFVSNSEVATSGQGGIKSDGFQTFVRQNRNALQTAGFRREELDLWERIAADLQRSNRSVASVKIPGGSDTAQNLLAVKDADGTGTMLSKIIATSGGSLAGSLLTPVVGPWGSAAGAALGLVLATMRERGLRTVDDIVRDALLDPQRARALMIKATPKTIKQNAVVLRQAYARGATRTAVTASDDEREEAR